MVVYYERGCLIKVFMNRRQETIKQILAQLHALEGNEYAVQENIRFFEAARRLPAYFKWLLGHARQIDSSRLLEINELLPQYDITMHTKLIEMERKRFPGLIEPLVERIVQIIVQAKRPIAAMSFGSGGMETERQIIERLQDHHHAYPVFFVGVDRSSSAINVAKKNLQEFAEIIEQHEIDQLDRATWMKIRNEQKKPFAVVYCKNDIFALDKVFEQYDFDLSYHSHFEHHLSGEQVLNLARIAIRISRLTLAYDGYRNWPGMIPQTIIGWNNPVFLNAEIFSNLRYPLKHIIQSKSESFGPEYRMSYHRPLGYFLREHNIALL